MANQNRNSSAQGSVFPIHKLKLAERQVLNFFEKRCRLTGKRLLTIPQIARGLDIKQGTAILYVGRLCRAGRLKKTRRRLGNTFEVVGQIPRKAPDLRSLQDWDPPAIKAVFAELRKKCARTGTWSGIHETLAKAVKLDRQTVGKLTRQLRDRKLITMDAHRNWSTYTIVGQAITNNEPSALSAEGKVFKFVREECARTGLMLCKQDIIAKSLRLNPTTVLVNMRTLHGKGLIKITSGRPNLCSVSDIVGAFPGEPPAFSIEEAMLKFVRDQCGGGTRSLSYETMQRQ